MSKLPPVPPANRSSKGTGQNSTPDSHDAEHKHVKQTDERTNNLEQQGQPANLRQNTRNQGYQQDR